jgi:hypothetical protein
MIHFAARIPVLATKEKAQQLLKEIRREYKPGMFWQLPGNLVASPERKDVFLLLTGPNAKDQQDATLTKDMLKELTQVPFTPDEVQRALEGEQIDPHANINYLGSANTGRPPGDTYSDGIIGAVGKNNVVIRPEKGEDLGDLVAGFLKEAAQPTRRPSPAPPTGKPQFNVTVDNTNPKNAPHLPDDAEIVRYEGDYAIFESNDGTATSRHPIGSYVIINGKRIRVSR